MSQIEELAKSIKAILLSIILMRIHSNRRKANINQTRKNTPCHSNSIRAFVTLMPNQFRFKVIALVHTHFNWIEFKFVIKCINFQYGKRRSELFDSIENQCASDRTGIAFMYWELDVGIMVNPSCFQLTFFFWQLIRRATGKSESALINAIELEIAFGKLE